jgi:hypothetical protein
MSAPITKAAEAHAEALWRATGVGDHASPLYAEAFAKAIAEETYRCAKLADDAQIPARRKALGNPDCAWNDACRDIATAIRASGGEGQSC